MPCFYLTPKQDDFTQELQICITEALYDAGREDQLTGTNDTDIAGSGEAV